VPKPYAVSIEIKPLPEEAWVRVAEEMSQKAIFAAKLLAGEMPQNIEEAFKAVGMSLFPESSKDIKTDCSCPDSANPCKHIAAVYYVLAEEFDRDPFMIFNLRGRTKDEITSSLRKIRTVDAPQEIPQVEVVSMQPEVPLSTTDFWKEGELESFSVNISKPEVSAAIIKRLGAPQFWDSGEDFSKTMGKLYEKVSERAIRNAYGEGEDEVKEGILKGEKKAEKKEVMKEERKAEKKEVVKEERKPEKKDISSIMRAKKRGGWK